MSRRKPRTITFTQFMNRMLKAFPFAECYEDTDGMINIATGLMSGPNDTVVFFEDKTEEEEDGKDSGS